MASLTRFGRYRNTFATILVLGSILQKLSGDDLNRFERWRGHTPVPGSPQDEREDPGERERDLGNEAAEDTRQANKEIDDIADEHFTGITGLMFRQHTRKLRQGSMELLDDKKDKKGKGMKRFKTMGSILD